MAVKQHWDYWLLCRLCAATGAPAPVPPIDRELLRLLDEEFPSRGQALAAIVQLERQAEKAVPTVAEVLSPLLGEAAL